MTTEEELDKSIEFLLKQMHEKDEKAQKNGFKDAHDQYMDKFYHNIAKNSDFFNFRFF